MFRQLVILAIVAAAFVQCAVPANKLQALQESALDDKFVDWLNNLKEAVKDAINSAVEKLTKLKDSIKEKAEEIIKRVTDTISEQFENLTNEIERIKEEAQELGIDAKECIGDKEDELKKLVEDFKQKIYQFGEDKVNEGKDIVNKTITEVKEAVNYVDELADEYSACEDTACKLDVVTKIAGAIFSIPLSITENVAQATKFVATLFLDVEVFAIKNVRELGSRGQVIVSDIARCVSDKVNTTTPENVDTTTPENVDTTTSDEVNTPTPSELY